MIALTLLIASAQTGAEAQVLLDSLRLSLAGGTRAKLETSFIRKEDGESLFGMAENRGGLRNLKVAMIPAPTGWTKGVKFWAIFHGRQDIEGYTDKIFGVALTANGALLGKEIPYIFDSPYRIKHEKLNVKLAPEANRVAVTATVDFVKVSGEQSPIVCLGDWFDVSSVEVGSKKWSVVLADDRSVPTISAGQVLRAGGLLVFWGPPAFGDSAKAKFDYGSVINTPADDKITPNVTYLTAWWAPTVAQLPFTTETVIEAPKDWVLRAEGVPDGPNSFRCDIPIAFPKVIAGKFQLAAEKTENGKTFRAWQLGTVDKARGDRDVAKMSRACKFYEDNLGPFPFPSYEVLDGDTYYGIESYSYTLLNYRYTTRFVSHEMGHTYFGGLVPCSYLKDTWNEGITQYVDSVLLDKNADRTLENGLRTLSIPKPLSKMDVAWNDGNATYMRGAYVMRMLENEIGLDKVLEGLRSIVKDRVGKETVWDDLRPYFEKSSGKNLDWFWNQWIDNAVFPTLSVASAELIERDGKMTTYVRIAQKGTADYRLRFVVRLTGPTGQKAERICVIGSATEEFQIDSAFKPVDVQIDVFGYSLATAGPARKLNP
jgi:hypothetical protein